MSRIFNFAAGPSMMPEEVLCQARDEMLDWQGQGLGVMEMPFTGEMFKEIARETEAALRRLFGVPSNYKVLFLHGGATALLSLIPMNLAPQEGAAAAYVETGYWSGRAIQEAGRYLHVNVAASAAAEDRNCRFTHIPPPDQWRFEGDEAYCHITSNETAGGVQFHTIPDTPGIPLVADMTSDFGTRPVDVSKFGLIYASAQKNLGPAGLSIVILRDDLIRQPHGATPSVFSFLNQAEAESRFNTPPTYAIYMAGLMLRWIEDKGGLEVMAGRAEKRSAQLYDLIDTTGFYRCPVSSRDRSKVNLCFTLADSDLEDTFLTQAQSTGLANLKGHKMIGGIRASLYNAMPDEGVDALAGFMAEFARRNG